MKIFGFEFGRTQERKVTMVDDLNPFAYAGQTSTSPWENSIFDGGKFAGGFGSTQIQEIDYWTLRARSIQLFNENPFARGIIRRLITNEINTGLSPEACPDEAILGVVDESLNDWTENVESRFGLWGKNPKVCDWRKASTFGALQRAARQGAFIEGDMLVVLRQSQQTRLPMVQLVSGSKVRTPLGGSEKLRNGHKIRHGVEIDSMGRVVAHWVDQDDGSSKRIAAFGEKTGRRVSWLIYGTDKRLDDIRGQPLLSIVMQSLKEIDRYRDSAQRKATVNSFMAMFIEKNNDKMGTLPVQGGATKHGQATVTGNDGTPRNFNVANMMPGMVPEELQQGEKPILLGGQGTDVNYGPFEETILSGIAWSLEMPPEILKLSFSSNYSASQAAINELKITINRVWGDFGETFCDPIYTEWLLSETLLQKIKAPGLLEAWRNPSEYDVFGAWTATDWYGSIKPSTDMLKQVKGSDMLIQLGLSTHAREARVTTGTKYSKNIKRLKRENQQKADAMRPLLEIKAEFGEEETTDVLKALDSNGELEAFLDDYLDEKNAGQNNQGTG